MPVTRGEEQGRAEGVQRSNSSVPGQGHHQEESLCWQEIWSLKWEALHSRAASPLVLSSWSPPEPQCRQEMKAEPQSSFHCQHYWIESLWFSKRSKGRPLPARYWVHLRPFHSLKPTHLLGICSTSFGSNWNKKPPLPCSAGLPPSALFWGKSYAASSHRHWATPPGFLFLAQFKCTKPSPFSSVSPTSSMEPPWTLFCTQALGLNIKLTDVHWVPITVKSFPSATNT